VGAEQSRVSEDVAARNSLEGLQSQLLDFGADPLIIDRGEGVHIFDTAGRRYLDAMSGYWTACLGYGDPELCSTLAEASNRLSCWHQFETANVPALRYVEDLWPRLPPDLRGKVLFADSGSGAVEIALRVACARVAQAGKAVRLAHLGRSYHGSTFLAQQLSDRRWNDWPSSLKLPAASTIDLPAPVGEAAATQALEEFDRACRGLAPPNVLITEPVQGVGGMNVPPEGFFGRLGELCRRHGVVWISDEVSTGFGATGRLFAFEREPVLPDLVVVGKRMAAGYCRLSAVLVSRELTASVLRGQAFHHGYTLSAHPVACAVARAVLGRIVGLLGEVRARGEQLRAGLEALRHKRTAIRGVNGRGLMLSAELASSAMATRVAHRLRKLGVYELPEGKYLTFCPPFVIQPRQIEELLGALDEALCGES
jgi:4-aminobutyrate--pyruvate transaminase